jgi:hypothetical protein
MNTMATTAPCRLVTADEVAHYKANGWVKLKSFIEPSVVRTILAFGHEKMGADGDSNDHGESETAYFSIPFFNPEDGPGLSHPVARPLINQIGKSTKLLMARRPDLGVRYFNDVFMTKLPSSKPSKHGGNGATGFHQDFISHGVDRSGGMTFWIPLEAYGPDAGTMQFISGSHRAGVMGDHATYGDGDLLDAYPELRELPLSEAMSYEVGDVTVHSDLVVHGAGQNLTAGPRWAYTIGTKPADIRWTGAPFPGLNHTGMSPWQEFGDWYPIIS